METVPSYTVDFITSAVSQELFYHPEIKTLAVREWWPLEGPFLADGNKATEKAVCGTMPEIMRPPRSLCENVIIISKAIAVVRLGLISLALAFLTCSTDLLLEKVSI